MTRALTPALSPQERENRAQHVRRLSCAGLRLRCLRTAEKLSKQISKIVKARVAANHEAVGHARNDGRMSNGSPHPSLSPHPMRGEGGFSRVRGVPASGNAHATKESRDGLGDVFFQKRLGVLAGGVG